MEKESCIKHPKHHLEDSLTREEKIKILCLVPLFLSVASMILSVISIVHFQAQVDTLQKQFLLITSDYIKQNIEQMRCLLEFQQATINRTSFNNTKRKYYLENDDGPTVEYENDKSYDDDKTDDDKTDDSDYFNSFESEGIKLKKKREIRDYDVSSEKENKSTQKNNTGKSEVITDSAEKEKSSTEVSSEIASKEKFLSAPFRITTGSTKKPRFHKKLRKSRIGSAEKYYMEYLSTTTTPIQVRRSRTKSTESQDIDKSVWLSNEKFQQHTSPHRHTITKEEAYFRGYGRLSSEETTHSALDTSREGSKFKAFDYPMYNMITIHFSADTSHYSRERDPHYFGNGRMQIKSEVYKDWKPAHWTQGVDMSKYFHLHQGKVTVSTTGIYLIYAQIQYSNVQEVNGFSVFRNKEVVVQCITTSTHPDKHEIKSNTCGISTTILLQSNDTVCIKDLHHGRYVVLTPEKSYFGLVLLSPFKN